MTEANFAFALSLTVLGTVVWVVGLVGVYCRQWADPGAPVRKSKRLDRLQRVRLLLYLLGVIVSSALVAMARNELSSGLCTQGGGFLNKPPLGCKFSRSTHAWKLEELSTRSSLDTAV